MLVKQEVEEIVQYCQENGKSFKERLNELDIPSWKFYADEITEFFGTPVPEAKQSRRSLRKENEVSLVNIEIKTATGCIANLQTCAKAIIRCAVSSTMSWG